MNTNSEWQYSMPRPPSPNAVGALPKKNKRERQAGSRAGAERSRSPSRDGATDGVARHRPRPAHAAGLTARLQSRREAREARVRVPPDAGRTAMFPSPLGGIILI